MAEGYWNDNGDFIETPSNPDPLGGLIQHGGHMQANGDGTYHVTMWQSASQAHPSGHHVSYDVDAQGKMVAGSYHHTHHGQTPTIDENSDHARGEYGGFNGGENGVVTDLGGGYYCDSQGNIYDESGTYISGN